MISSIRGRPPIRGLAEADIRLLPLRLVNIKEWIFSTKGPERPLSAPVRLYFQFLPHKDVAAVIREIQKCLGIG